MYSPVLSIALLWFGKLAGADPLDWVNFNYITQQSSVSSSTRTSTREAQMAIIGSAQVMTKRGPWTITSGPDNLPPSRDPRDYLSWAPYHWPACKWCNSKGRQHIAHDNRTQEPGDGDGDGNGNGNGHAQPPTGTDYYSDGFFLQPDHLGLPAPRTGQNPIAGRSRRRMYRVNRRLVNLNPDAVVVAEVLESPPQNAVVQMPLHDQPDIASPVTLSLETTPTLALQAAQRTFSEAPPAALHPAKTQKGDAECTPSPTKSLAPSATWTTCPYQVRDGNVNPDVRKLNGPGAIQSLSQTALFNAIAYALTGDSNYASSLAYFVYVFFLDPDTGMNPNINYGQVVRGPGPKGKMGTYTGILDLRGIAKVVNAVSVLRATGSPQWTSYLDQAMTDWMTRYTEWLTMGVLGKDTATRPNNHGSFYYSQLGAAKILAYDNDSAADAVQYYFSHQFQDQVAASGEQPFEAVRTRPYHYRCFNLEAMITNAKIGDQLGLDLWSVKSKYGATIQTAVDFLMRTDPKTENQSELLPHVAAVAAAYGDPTGKYATFLKQRQDYQRQPFWFYDQTAALPNAPAARNKTLRTVQLDSARSIPFECPDVFNTTPFVELDNEVFVSCDQLKPFYEILA